MTVAYREDPAITINVNVIWSWKRGEITPVFGSSGLKDYLRNDVWSVFDHIREATKVVLVRGQYLRSVPFLLVVDDAGRWFDMEAKEVVVT